GDALSRIHACMGCAVLIDDEVVGAVMFDALAPDAFADVELHSVMMIARMAGVAIRTSALASALDHIAPMQQGGTRQLVREALDRMGGELLGISPAIVRVRQEIELLARSELTTLITGETGVGKELVAHAIHTKSRRAKRPMVIVNCAALPDTLAESELFGHLRGSFTGAVEHRAGKFEVA